MKNIRNVFEEYVQDRGISKASIASKMGLSQQNFQKKVSKNSFDTDFLAQLCVAIKYNLIGAWAKEVEKAIQPIGLIDRFLLKDYNQKVIGIDANIFLEILDERIEKKMEIMKKNNEDSKRNNYYSKKDETKI